MTYRWANRCCRVDWPSGACYVLREMNIIQITPGAGKMFCGACMRDNALVAELRKLGHSVVMIPLYLPLTLDEEDQSAGTPTFFGGINVYLQQQSAIFRKLPSWLHNLLASPTLLKLAAGSAGKTRAQDLGEMTLSILRGEQGNQARELDELIVWLKTQPVDLICLSNALLAGLARRLRAELNVPVVCSLQGEDWFLDSLPEKHRALAWQTLAERAREVDLFIAPSHCFGELMRKRLGFAADKLKVVPNGIHLDGYKGVQSSEFKVQSSPVLGYFARMCAEKGINDLVEAYLILRQRGKKLKLKIGGSCGPADEPVVNSLKQKLEAREVLGDVEFHPNTDRAGKIAFLKSLTVFSVPALYGEGFGLYVIEAMAAGVPVVEPDTAAFPELLADTGGGVICPPGNPIALADAIERLLADPARARALGEAGQKAVFEKFSAAKMAEQIAAVYFDALQHFPLVNRPS